VSESLREQMLASATEAVNTLCMWAHNQLMSDFDAREEKVLKTGRELLATWFNARQIIDSRSSTELEAGVRGQIV
jgi:hypothetical protein